MAAKTNNNKKPKPNRKVLDFLIKVGRPSQLKIIIFVIIFAGVGVIALRPTFAFAGYHDWSEPLNRIDWNHSYLFKDDHSVLCSYAHPSGGYFLYGPYDNFWVTNPSGMDITMAFSGGINPYSGNVGKWRIDITSHDGLVLLAGPTDSNGRDQTITYASAHLKQGYYYHVEYRIAALSGDTCLHGYDIYTR